MENLITVYTPYSYKQLRDFRSYVNKPRGIKNIFSFIVFLSFMTYFWFNYNYSIFHYILFILSSFLFVTGFLVTFDYLGLFPSEKYFNDSRKNVAGSATITFHEEFFEETTNIDALSQISKWKYDSIEKICETYSMIYIFLNKNFAVFIDKSGFCNGNIDDLKTLLLSKCPPEKFK